MQAVTTVGLDIAKSVFQIHGVDAAGNVIVRRQLKRRYGSNLTGRPVFFCLTIDRSHSEQRLPPLGPRHRSCAACCRWRR